MFLHLDTFVVAAGLATFLLLAGHLSLAETTGKRNALSAAAGGSIAYVFISLLPEIENAAMLFRQETYSFMPFEGVHGVNLAMLAGFLSFYALAEIAPAELESGQQVAQSRAFWGQVLGYGGYIALIGYLLVHSLDAVEGSLLLYAISMSFHFLLVGFGLRELHQKHYDSIGRYVLAAFCLLGWFAGVMIDLPKSLVVLLFGFVSGGVVSVTGIVELPKGKEGKVGPFIAGALGFAFFLMVCR